VGVVFDAVVGALIFTTFLGQNSVIYHTHSSSNNNNNNKLYWNIAATRLD